jgi:hypothetical protein
MTCKYQKLNCTCVCNGIVRDLPLRQISEKKLESLGALGVDPLRIEAFGF